MAFVWLPPNHTRIPIRQIYVSCFSPIVPPGFCGKMCFPGTKTQEIHTGASNKPPLRQRLCSNFTTIVHRSALSSSKLIFVGLFFFAGGKLKSRKWGELHCLLFFLWFFQQFPPPPKKKMAGPRKTTFGGGEQVEPWGKHFDNHLAWLPKAL